MSFQTNTLSNSRSTRVAENRSQNEVIVPERALEVSAFVQDFQESLNKLRTEYNTQIERAHIRQIDDVRNFQWNFWKQMVMELHVENAQVYVLMNKSRAGFSPDAIKMCWNKINQFYMMLKLLNRDVRSGILNHSVDKSALIVLISVDEIRKFRCREYLTYWKAMRFGNQTAVSEHPDNSSIKLDETESQIAHHVREFLKLIYETCKRS